MRVTQQGLSNGHHIGLTRNKRLICNFGFFEAAYSNHR
jgi:hypothetical protein